MDKLTKSHPNRPRPRIVSCKAENPLYSNSLRDKLLNSPRSLQRSRRKHFRPHRPNILPQESILCDTPTESEPVRVVSHYSELPLINLSQANTSELEEYDNSSLNFSDYLTNENTIYTDTKAFYPFPNQQFEAGFECKVYNRIDRSTMMASQSLQTSFDLNHKFSNACSINNTSSSIQNSISSDSSFSYSNSPENTINVNTSSGQNGPTMIQRPSMIQQPYTTKSTRFGFKPGIPTSQNSSIPAPAYLPSKQPQLKMKKPTSISLTPESPINPSNSDVTQSKLHIDEPVSPPVVTSNLPATSKIHTKRMESPVRSFLKPPTPVTGLTPPPKPTNAIKKPQSIQKPVKNLKEPSELRISSSVSSLSSSTSSSYSNKKQMSPIKKSESVPKNSKQVKSSIPNPKSFPVKQHTTKPSASKPTSTSANPNFQSNPIKPPSTANASGQHKRRLFNPYPNVTVTGNSNNSNFINKSNNVNNNSNENHLDPAETFVTSNPDENLVNCSNNYVKENSQIEQKSHKFKLYNNASSPTKSKTNSNLKSSKMPVKNFETQLKQSTNSKISTSKLKTQANKSPQQTSPVQDNSKALAINENNFMKREDSAYCSSTSSTVSSQDVEVSKFPINKLTNKSPPEVTDANRDPVVDLVENDPNENNENECISESNELTDEPNSELISSKNSTKQRLTKRNSIKESIGELNQLMSTSSTFGNNPNDDTTTKSNTTYLNKQRRTSSTSLSQVSGSSERGAMAPMFKPPSNLPPVENSEVILLDIETYRLILQDAQQTKTILYKLMSMLQSNTVDSNLMNDSQITSSFFGNLSQGSEKVDQTTQTD